MLIPFQSSFLTQSRIRILILITLLSRPRSRRLLTPIPTAPTSLAPHPPLLLKLAPPLHRDLRTVKFALIFNTCFLGFLACCLASVTPGEVVEFPKGVDGEDEIPDREGE